MYLERLLTILEAIADRGPSRDLSVSEIVAATGLPKPSVYRQVADLVEAGLLEARGSGRYAIGARAKRLSGHALADARIRDLAAPLLKQAARTHGATFFLSHLVGQSVEIVQAEVPKSGVSYLHPGLGPRPLHACSCAKVIAALSPDPDLHTAMAARLRAYTDQTKTDIEDLEQEFEQIRNAGFAQCVEELEDGVCSVAAAVIGPDNHITYSLGATGTTRVLSPANREKLGAVAIELCATLGVLIHETGAAAQAGQPYLRKSSSR